MSNTALTTILDGEHTVVIGEQDDHKAILLMDRMDLDQAMAELRGEVVAQFVYTAKGKQQLSYAGIKEAARLYRNVHFGATAVPLQNGGWMITSYAHNLADNTRVDYPMPYPPFDPSDPAASIEFRATLSKSLRNALAAVLPITYLNTMMKQWMDQKSGQRPQSKPVQQAQPQRQLPAPTPSVDRDTELKQLMGQIRQKAAQQNRGPVTTMDTLNKLAGDLNMEQVETWPQVTPGWLRAMLRCMDAGPLTEPVEEGHTLPERAETPQDAPEPPYGPDPDLDDVEWTLAPPAPPADSNGLSTQANTISRAIGKAGDPDTVDWALDDARQAHEAGHISDRERDTLLKQGELKKASLAKPEPAPLGQRRR